MFHPCVVERSEQDDGDRGSTSTLGGVRVNWIHAKYEDIRGNDILEELHS